MIWCELILLEEFKKCLPERIVVYLNEQYVMLLSSVAVLADEYVLTHSLRSALAQQNGVKKVLSLVLRSLTARAACCFACLLRCWNCEC